MDQVNTAQPAEHSQAARAEYVHEPVLVDEVLAVVPDSTRLAVDATLGGGGHAAALLEALPSAELFGCDRDGAAVEAARARLAPYAQRILLKHIPFSELPRHVAVASVDFLLVDLGVSSHQLDTAARGFSFTRDGPLDMRMDPQSTRVTAHTLVNKTDVAELRDILYRYGEERFAPRIVRAIEDARREEPIESTKALAALVSRAVPRRFHGPHHPATRTFQALRMAINGELEELDALLAAAPKILAPRGRIAVISFHSLEDRAVKSVFRHWAAACECPPRTPVCVCGKTSLGSIITRKPVTPGDRETASNPRARSAKLRVFENLGPPPVRKDTPVTPPRSSGNWPEGAGQ